MGLRISELRTRPRITPRFCRPDNPVRHSLVVADDGTDRIVRATDLFLDRFLADPTGQTTLGSCPWSPSDHRGEARRGFQPIRRPRDACRRLHASPRRTICASSASRMAAVTIAANGVRTSRLLRAERLRSLGRSRRRRLRACGSRRRKCRASVLRIWLESRFPATRSPFKRATRRSWRSSMQTVSTPTNRRDCKISRRNWRSGVESSRRDRDCGRKSSALFALKSLGQWPG